MSDTTERHDMAVIHSSLDPNWRTPVACFEKLNVEFHFGMDLAADKNSCLVPTDFYLGPCSARGQNSLTVNWHECMGGGEPGFLNPPFSRTLAAAYRTGRIKDDTKAPSVWIPHPIDLAMAAAYEIDSWASKAWHESQRGFTTVAVMPYAPQTDWWRTYVEGHGEPDERGVPWSGHAAMEVRRIPHRISFLRADGSAAANAGVNSAIVVWRPNPGFVGPWTPFSPYWSYR